MARAKRAAPVTPAPEPEAAAAPLTADAGLIAALKAFEAAHGVVLDMPPAEAFAPGAVVLVTTSSPMSAERFTAEARELPGFSAVRLLPSQIEVELVVPAEGAA